MCGYLIDRSAEYSHGRIKTERRLFDAVLFVYQRFTISGTGEKPSGLSYS